MKWFLSKGESPYLWRLCPEYLSFLSPQIGHPNEKYSLNFYWVEFYLLNNHPGLSIIYLLPWINSNGLASPWYLVQTGITGIRFVFYFFIFFTLGKKSGESYIWSTEHFSASWEWEQRGLSRGPRKDPTEKAQLFQTCPGMSSRGQQEKEDSAS